MTDRELLELAAKAAGYKIQGDVDYMIVQPDHRKGGYVIRNDRGGDSCWNPLTDDGDALRLAVKLDLFWEQMELFDIYMDNKQHEPKNVRRAIVRAAAEIGKAS
jgi:hypothetical protein